MKAFEPAAGPRPLAAWIVGLAALSFILIAGDAQAEPLHILALGASNTAGAHADGRGWANQLGPLLKAKGIEAKIDIRGVVGDTSAGILRRADAIPAGTTIVIFDVGKGNDVDAGTAGASSANRAQIEARIRAHGAKPIFVPYAQIVGNEKANPSAWRAGDAHHHLTVPSHTRVAAWLVPKVIAASH